MASVNSPPQSTVVGNWAAPPDTIEPAPKKRVVAILAVILVGMIFGAFVLIEFLLPFEWDGEIWDDGGESMNWPDDPFQAAVYSFVAEYELGYGAAVGIYHDYVNGYCRAINNMAALLPFEEIYPDYRGSRRLCIPSSHE